MSQTIDILVTRAAPFWLPDVIERDENGVKKYLARKLMLRPGANTIRRDRWEVALKHPTVALHASEEVGTLKAEPSAREVTEHSHAPDSLTGLTNLSIAKAKPWVAAATDIELLSKWRTQEAKGKARNGLLTLIDDRMVDLEEE